MAFWASRGSANQGIDDLVLLPKVTDDAITSTLSQRYKSDQIYTYLGTTLVAVNPYQKLPALYTQEKMWTYRGQGQQIANPPHVFAVAEEMFQNLLSNEDSQAVIISGESGAGKTESAKLILNYIAFASGKGVGVVEKVKEVVMESNPLLEAFGNAKTLRNENSSRFGKYFEINFTRGAQPIGGTITNFLLESSRVVSPSRGERNFHVFYQLTTSASPAESAELGLANGPKAFNYLACSGMFEAIGQDDGEGWREMRKAMGVCGIDAASQMDVLRVLAGILHLGNVFFDEENNAAFIKPNTAASLDWAASLLGVDRELLLSKLTSRYLETSAGYGRREAYSVPLNTTQALATRDALAKAVYSRLFDYIVAKVNAAMVPEQKGGLCFGVLDIYGFEIFDRNGFEQLCINYINERLQQIFISLTLQNEQQEYRDEGIQWTPIEFFNNKVVVDLIEAKRPPGIMSVLDDVCFTMHAVSDGADETFVQKLDAAVSGNRHYEGRGRQFIVHHYAGSVNYTCDGFVEANKDTLTKDLVQVMQSSARPFITALFPENLDEQDKKRPPTASMKIRNQSQALVDTLMRCVPSYVRCIKPNENKKPREFDAQRVLHQVVYLNLKENVKIRRAGFCARYPFDKFLKRYAIITKQTYPQWTGDPRQGIQIIMQAVQMAPDQYQMGKSKVFIKAPESLFLCEEARERKYDHYARVIQRAYRRWKSRKQFIELREQSVAIVFGKKERKRFSLSREFIGDYIGYHDDPVLRMLVGQGERVVYADQVIKYDRRYKTEERELLVSDKAVMIVGLDKAPDGPHKGKLVKMVKRKIPLNAVSGVSLSTRADDFVVLHAPEYDSVMSTPFKTEFVTVLTDQYRRMTGRNLQLNFSDQITYTVKKTFWSRGGSQSLIFIPDPSCPKAVVKPGDKAEVRIAPGMPPDSRPRALTWEGAVSAAKEQKRGGGAMGRGPVPPAPSGYAPPPPSAPPLPPTNGVGYGRPPAPSFAAPSFPGGVPPPPPLSALPQQPSAPALDMYGPPQPRPPQFGKLPSQTPTPPPAIPTAAVGANDLAAIAAKKRAPPPPPPKRKGTKARALYDYQAQEADELTFNAEDTIWITKKLDDGWWQGIKDGTTKEGLLPANYVEEV